jgi:hypothetical protein
VVLTVKHLGIFTIQHQQQIRDAGVRYKKIKHFISTFNRLLKGEEDFMIFKILIVAVSLLGIPVFAMATNYDVSI